MVDKLKQDLRSKDPKIRREATKKRMKFLQGIDKTQSMRTKGKLIPASKERGSLHGKPSLTREQLLQRAKVKRDQRKKKRFALGGEAGESVGRATVVKSQRDARRKLLDDSINRVYKKVSEAKKIGKIKPKKKPKNPNRIKPKKKPKKPQESIVTIRPPKKKKNFVFFNNKTGKFRLGETAREGEKKFVLDGSPVKAKNKRDLMNQRFDNAFAGTKFKKQSKGPAGKVMKKKKR